MSSRSGRADMGVIVLLIVIVIASCSPRDTAPSDTAAFTERTVVFLLADSAQIEAVRAELSEDDFYVVADDMMWYRAEAWDWFEERGFTVLSIEGRPPLRFRVGGEDRSYDFSDEDLLDLVVIYEPGREPLAIAPIDVATAAADYFE